MKAIFRNNCAGCHQPNFVLQNKFDADGWRNIINVMERVGIYGDPPRLDQAPLAAAPDRHASTAKAFRALRMRIRWHRTPYVFEREGEPTI